MKCISLWQPWATLWVMGAKVHETRGWPTNYRGKIAVHAAKRWTQDQIAFAHSPRCMAALSKAGYVHDRPVDLMRSVVVWPEVDLPLGAIVGVVDLAGCHQCWYGGCGVPDGDTDDYHFGDFRPGRFAWRAENPRRLAEPVPYRGQQGIFEIDDALVTQNERETEL